MITPKIKKFLLVVDDDDRELYILHREFPSCLIWVKQETPVRYIVLDLYDDVEDPNTILLMPFVEEAKEFFRKKMEKSLDKN